MKKILFALFLTLYSTFAFANCDREELRIKGAELSVRLKELIKQNPEKFQMWRNRIKDLAQKESLEGLDVEESCKLTDQFIKEIEDQLH